LVSCSFLFVPEIFVDSIGILEAFGNYIHSFTYCLYNGNTWRKAEGGSKVRELIANIIKLEWGMFDKVNNKGGRADCQNNKQTFIAMRASQFEAWNQEVLQSYLNDLLEAEASGRNLLTEKYAYMMEFTSPGEFSAIKDVLPEISEEKENLIEEISRIKMEWTEDMHARYPLAASQGRPLYSSEDGPNVVSIETYMVGELKTYSTNTLALLLNMIKGIKKEGKNLPVMILNNTACKYGYKSVDELEEKLRERVINK
jgi:hypothetical protein